MFKKNYVLAVLLLILCGGLHVFGGGVTYRSKVIHYKVTLDVNGDINFSATLIGFSGVELAQLESPNSSKVISNMQMSPSGKANEALHTDMVMMAADDNGFSKTRPAMVQFRELTSNAPSLQIFAYPGDEGYVTIEEAMGTIPVDPPEGGVACPMPGCRKVTGHAVDCDITVCCDLISTARFNPRTCTITCTECSLIRH